MDDKGGGKIIFVVKFVVHTLVGKIGNNSDKKKYFVI